MTVSIESRVGNRTHPGEIAMALEDGSNTPDSTRSTISTTEYSSRNSMNYGLISISCSTTPSPTHQTGAWGYGVWLPTVSRGCIPCISMYLAPDRQVSRIKLDSLGLGSETARPPLITMFVDGIHDSILLHRSMDRARLYTSRRSPRETSQKHTCVDSSLERTEVSLGRL